jgi:hypothetical protein
MSRTLIARAERHRLELVVIVLTEIVRMAETVVDAVEGPVAAGGIVDAAGAVDVLVGVGDGIAADAAGRAGEGTRNLPRICADSHGYEKGPRHVSWPFSCAKCLWGTYYSCITDRPGIRWKWRRLPVATL